MIMIPSIYHHIIDNTTVCCCSTINTTKNNNITIIIIPVFGHKQPEGNNIYSLYYSTWCILLIILREYIDRVTYSRAYDLYEYYIALRRTLESQYIIITFIGEPTNTDVVSGSLRLLRYSAPTANTPALHACMYV